MATVQELRRVIDIRSRTTGVKESAADLQKLDRAYSGVAIESVKMEKATLSVDRQFASLQRRIDPTFRATERLAAAERTLNAAHAQGLITLARKNELMGLAAVQSDRAAAATTRMAGAMRLLSGLGLGVGLVTLTQLPRLIKDVVDEASALVDTADKIGISTRALQELKFAAGQSGVEFSELSGGLSFFNKAIGEAARGGGDLLKILQANKVAVRNQAGEIRPLMDLLGDYADLVAGAGDAQDRTTLVTKAFGRANDELINTLAGGSAALRTWADEANRSGLILEDGLLRRSEELGDRWDKFTAQLTVGWQTFVLSVVDGVSTIEAAYARLQAMKPPPGTIFGGGLSTAGGGQYPSIVPSEMLDLSGASSSKKVVIDFEGRFNPPLSKTIVPEIEKTTKAVDAMVNGVKVPLPNVRPEIDNIAKSLELAEDQARGFAETLVGGLAGGEGVIGSLGNAISGLASSLGDMLGSKVSGLIGGATSGIFGSILSGLGGGLVSAVVSGLGGLFESIFGNNDAEDQAKREERRLRREEKRQDEKDQLQRREEKLLAKKEKQEAKNEASARRVESFSDRAFSAGLDTSTLEGQLAQFDLEAQREREELARTAGKKYNKEVIALDAALAAERLQIQQDFNDQMVEDAKQAQEEINRVARSIVDYVNGLNTGSDSPLSPTDRFAAAQSTYNSQLALAQSGNVDAQSSITQYADAFLKAAREMYASSAAFQDIFSTVKSQLLFLPAVQASDDPVVLALLAAQNAIVGAVDAMKTALAAAFNAGPAAFATAIAGNFSTLDTSMNGLIDFEEMKNALGWMATDAALLAMFKTLDTDNSGAISELEAIAGSLADPLNGLGGIITKLTNGLKISDIFNQSTILGLGLAQDASFATLLGDDFSGLRGVISKLGAGVKISDIFSVQTLAGLTGAGGLAGDTTLGSLLTDPKGLQKLYDGLTNTTDGLPGVNTKVTGVAQDASLTDAGDGSFVGLKNKLKDVTAGVADMKSDLKSSVRWLPVMAQRLYEISKFVGEGKKEKPIGGEDKTLYSVDDNINFANGGIIGAYAPGGIVGNGLWNVDSVRARYAGGGDIALAGGEGVINAQAMKTIGPSAFDMMNRTGRAPQVDNARHFADQNRVMLAVGRSTIEALERLETRLARIEAANNNTTRAVREKPVAKPQTKVA